MKRKFLAVMLSTVMAAGILPGAVIAAPGTEDTAGIQSSQETETMAGTAVQQESVRADVIDTQTELEAAIAQGGEIDLNGQRIELTSPLYINNDVVIRGGTLVGTDSVTGNLVTLMGNSITLEGVTVRTSAGNRSALHAYGTDLTVNGLTVDHSSASGGAPVILNNGTEADFNGSIRLVPGAASWYGINVDSARADFSGADLNVTPVTDTQSVICEEGNGASVSGAGLTVVVTENDGGAGHRQTAYVADANLAQFVKAKTEAGADVSLIELNKDVTLTAPLFLSEAMTVRSSRGSYVISGSDAVGRDNVVTVTSDGVSLEQIGIRTTAANKSPLHIYRVSATLRDVTLDNQETAGGAGMIVNGGNVTVEGGLNLLLGENSWGGINMDTTNGAAAVTFTDGSAVAMTGSSQSVIYIDEDDDADQATVTGAEEAGLAQDADGNYILAGQQENPDPDPENPENDPDLPGDGEDGSNPENDGNTADDGEDTDDRPSADGGSTAENDNTASDKETDSRAPKTGDSSTVLYTVMAALLSSGAAAGTILKKKNR